MSRSEPEVSGPVFCDTSVLLNYVLGQGNDGAQRLLAESDRRIVISEKVNAEFNRVPDRREDIYLDFMELIPLDSQSVEDLTLTGRDYLSPNDEAFFNRLQDEIADEDDIQQRLVRLREIQRSIDRRYGQTEEMIHEVCPQNDDIGLLLQLGSIIPNEDDCQVVSDAVQWSAGGGNGAFATLDVGDIISNADAINETIEEYHEEDATLDIGPPGDFIQSDS